MGIFEGMFLFSNHRKKLKGIGWEFSRRKSSFNPSASSSGQTHSFVDFYSTLKPRKCYLKQKHERANLK
jgi:hypothetical protein